jgi:hypothetical protein
MIGASGEAIYAIDAFPDDDLLWRLEWIGGIRYNTSVPSDPLIDICLAQLPGGETHPLSARSRSSETKIIVKIGVGLLPCISIASVWQKRRPVTAYRRHVRRREAGATIRDMQRVLGLWMRILGVLLIVLGLLLFTSPQVPYMHRRTTAVAPSTEVTTKEQRVLVVPRAAAALIVATGLLVSILAWRRTQL